MEIAVYFHPELKKDKGGAGVAFDMLYESLMEKGYNINVGYGPPGDRLLNVKKDHVQKVLDAFNRTEEFCAELSLTD